MTTALDVYYKALSDGVMPAAVPIGEQQGDGIGTVVFNCALPGVHELAFSDDQVSRGRLAVYACAAARQQLVSQHPDIQVS
jgi:hypothetical protein